MKRLGIFLVGAMIFFELGYALTDRETFFGSSEPGPVAGRSERPAVEAALARLDAALIGFYADGGEEPLRALLANADEEGSPLWDWAGDRHAWALEGPVPTLTLRERTISHVSLVGLKTVAASASERWDLSFGGIPLPGSTVFVRYQFDRADAGLLVRTVAVEP